MQIDQGLDERHDQRILDWCVLHGNTLVHLNSLLTLLTAGTLGPVLFGLTFRDSTLTIIFFNLFSCAVPAYFATFGPRLGMRQMTMARYSYGYFGAILPALLNLVSFIGFCAINAIAAGQVLAAINPGSISINVGIVIVAVVSMVISFCVSRKGKRGCRQPADRCVDCL